MALQVEIWVKSIIEGLFANNTFAARSVDHSEFVNEKTVHVPNAGAAPNVEKNRTVFPANVTERKDVDLIYQMDEFTVDPVRIPHAEQVELSYNKRESVTRQSRRKLAQDIHDSIIYNWIPEGVKVVETLGEAVAAHIKEATGSRKRMTKQTIEELQTLFDEQDIPEEGRCILLDARMYNQLLNSLTDAERNGFLVCADPARGVIGKYLGFDFYKRSKVAKVATDGALKPWSAANAATDCAAGLAWHEDCVSRASVRRPGQPALLRRHHFIPPARRRQEHPGRQGGRGTDQAGGSRVADGDLDYLRHCTYRHRAGKLDSRQERTAYRRDVQTGGPASGGDHPSDGQSREAGGQGRDQGARVGAQERDNPGSFPLQDAFAQVPRVNQVIRVQRSKGR